MQLTGWQHNLLYALLRTRLPETILVAFGKVLGDGMDYIQPTLVSELLKFITDSDCYPRWYPYFISLLIFSVSFVQSLIIQHNTHFTARLALHRRTMCMGLIFRKSLRIGIELPQPDDAHDKQTHVPADQDDSGATETGTVANLMANDCDKIMLASLNFQNIYWQPLSIAICIVLLYSHLGVSSLVGLGIWLFLLPIQILVAKKLNKLRKLGRKVTDHRVGLIHEFFVGIRIVKLLAWEEPILNKVSKNSSPVIEVTAKRKQGQKPVHTNI